MLGVFYAYTEEYEHNDCFLKTKPTFTTCKLNFRKLQCLWPVDIHMLAVKWMFFFNVFQNNFQKIHKSVLHKIKIDLLYFWDGYDINLWEKLAIMVKLCFIETRLKKGYDFKNDKWNDKFLAIAVIHYFSWWTSFRNSCLEVSCKKVFLKFHKIYSKKETVTGVWISRNF